ncbi:MAG: calcium/sodium antiporter [Alphaproteobacteria bacterium]|nr:calcium/sodium antiporter [Alphaproteobacteria bacterium]
MDIALSFLGGRALLVAGGECLVRGAVRFAERIGMSPLLIVLTLVGFGTSTPELVTSVQAALAGSPGIAIGNIVGSNIANILLILGLAAILCPIAVRSRALKRDGGVVLGAAILLAGLAAATTLDRTVGIGFVLLLVLYILYAYRQERGSTGDHTAAFEKGAALEATVPHQARGHAQSAALDIAIALGIAVAGLVIVIVGGSILVDGAIALARGAGISETVIVLTIVAVGTSMPELVTSIVAAARRQADVALGNILGSNIYNVLGIGGLTALLAPVAVPVEIVRFDGPVMVAVSLLLLVFAATGMRIGRREGAVLVAGYAAYVAAIWPR